MRDALSIETQCLLPLNRYWVEETKTLNKAPVASAAAVRDDNMKIRTLFSAAASESNRNHYEFCRICKRAEL
jgi:hypothetical protein